MSDYLRLIVIAGRRTTVHVRIYQTVLVLYLKDTNHKNIVLPLCELCFGYKPGDVTQHQQLADWYFRIYDDKESFRFTSGFSLRTNGKLGFNSTAYNATSTSAYHTTNREMGPIEQDAVRKVVEGKLDNHIVTPVTRH